MAKTGAARAAHGGIAAPAARVPADDPDLRLDIGERYFELAMAQGDPRYVGYAMSTIAPLELSLIHI